MQTSRFLFLTVAVALLVIGAPAFAKRVNHDVTPANISKLPFSATIKVKDVGKMKEFEITIKDIKGPLADPSRASAPGGWLDIVTDGKAIVPPAVTKVEKGGVFTFTFQLSPEQVEGARFAFVEDASDWERPFPTNGNYYQFMLKDFVQPKK
jgi:hypothetical protein